jgi:hypothetical protein
MYYALTFLAGVLTGASVIFVWKVLRLLADARHARAAAQTALSQLHGTVKDQAAHKVVSECKNRLRWQRSLNPEWFQPLIVEVPRLVREIAAVYYPAEREPLLSPGLSQFTCAVHLAALDLSNFLQQRSIGRLVDVSAHTALHAYHKGRQVMESEPFQYAAKWYRRLLPVVQTVRYNSPIMWASLAVSNVAIRAIQPAVIDLVARRAIELYSGRLHATTAHPQLAATTAT